MRTVLFSHHLGRCGCGPERFRYNGQKGPVVDYLLRALCRIYRLSAIRISERQKIRTDILANTGPIMCRAFFRLFFDLTDQKQNSAFAQFAFDICA